jgi:hypothetical protein
MSRGHAVIINTSSWSPFIFQFNPSEIDNEKKINYAIAPNIGGAYKKRYFSGFDSKEINFSITCVDKESATGVMTEISYFEQLREPDPGPFGGWGLVYGNVNYPPPQVLFQFGVSYMPLFWEVLNVSIKESHFHSGHVRGILGYPKVCIVDITLSLVEDHVFNQANQVAKKAAMYAASARSVVRELYHKTKNTRKENPGISLKISKDW